MTKQPIKVIKQTDGKPKPSLRKKERPKKKRSIESTIQDWITERRENEDTADRSRNSQLAEWHTDNPPPAEAS